MQEQYILEVQNVTKRFPGIVANKDVNIQVRQGEVLGLIGENGAGKSTILGVINGVHHYGSYEGTVLVEGNEIKNHSTLDAQKAGIGFVPQEINVLGYLTLAENIFVSDLTRSSKTKLYVNFNRLFKEAQALFDKYGIRLNAKDKAMTLSIGQQQLLMIARALAQDPKILILDEPTTSLTNDDVEILYALMQTLKEQGITMMFVSHKLDEILTITDRVVVLRDGCNAGLFERKDYSRELIVEAMVGRKIENLYPSRISSPGDEILRVEHLSVEHPKIEGRMLIDDVSFSLKRGEVLGFAGLVGAGRTETVRAIYGMLKKSAGEVYISGKKTHIRNPGDAINEGLSLVTEDRKFDGLLWMRDLLSNITVNNLKAVSKFGWIPPKRIKARGMRYFDMLGVKATSIHDLATSLSGGNQQKIVLARAMNVEPKILLLDEPTKGIDVGAKNEIYNIINTIVAQGVSIIMISSELPELLAMCDRFIVMAGGKIRGELSKEEATDKNIMMLAAQ